LFTIAAAEDVLDIDVLVRLAAILLLVPVVVVVLVDMLAVEVEVTIEVVVELASEVPFNAAHNFAGIVPNTLKC
jgi:hypothetical protein